MGGGGCSTLHFRFRPCAVCHLTLWPIDTRLRHNSRQDFVRFFAFLCPWLAPTHPIGDTDSTYLACHHPPAVCDLASTDRACWQPSVLSHSSVSLQRPLTTTTGFDLNPFHRTHSCNLPRTFWFLCSTAQQKLHTRAPPQTCNITRPSRK